MTKLILVFASIGFASVFALGMLLGFPLLAWRRLRRAVVGAGFA